MSYFLIYLIKSTVYLGLFYAFFLIAMRKTTFFRFNRWMLLVGTFVCMLLPCHTITVEEVEGIQLPMQVLDEMLVLKATPEEVQPMVETTLSIQETEASAPVPRLPYLMIAIYALGAITYLMMVVRSLAGVWKLIASHPKQWKDGCWLIILPGKIPSFSWSNYIVISEEDYREYPQVLVHERMHYLCRHSYDVLFMIVVQTLHWFNPMVWLIQTELKQLHEFEVDEGVINQGIDATQYQLLLVKKAVGKKLYTIANGFNHTKLQKRITMMIQEKSNRWERLKWLVTVPLVMGAMLVFAQPKVKEKLEEVTPMVSQQDTKAEMASLKQFFDEQLTASEKKLRRADGSIVIRDKTVHPLIINSYNQVTLAHKPLQDNSPTAIANYLREARIKDKQATGKDEPHAIYLMYSASASEEIILQTIKDTKAAFDILRSEYITRGTKDIEMTCPFRVLIEELTEKKDEKISQRYKNIEVSVIDSKDGSVVATVKDIKHINQLKEALKKLPVDGSEPYAHVNLKADKNTPMGEINEIRLVLREHYFLKLNMEVNNSQKNQ